METTLFPTFEEVLFLHHKLISRYGEESGIRDKGLLESALTRPRSGYYSSLSEQAAALMHSIINSHCFVDGNKRVGFALTAIFLRLNGFQLKVPSKEAEFFIVEEIIGNGVDAYEIAVWLEKFLQPVQE